MRPRLLLTAAVWATLAASLLGARPSAVGQERRPDAAETAGVPQPIVELLDEQSRGWAARERGAIEKTTAGPARDRLTRAFDAAGELRFDPYRLRASTQFSADLASERVRKAYPGREVVAYHVIEEYAIAGAEVEPYVEDLFVTFARERADASDAYEGWRMVSTSDFEILGGFSAHHLWDGGPVRTARSAHFTLLAHPDTIERVQGVLDVAERSYEAVRKFWPRPVGDRYVIVAPSTSDELAAMLQSTVDLSKFVAFAVGTPRREEGWRFGGVRIFLQLSHFEQRNEPTQRNILSHELIHAVTRPAVGPFVPIWVEEGLAMYGAVGESELDGRVGGAERFPPDHEFSVGTTREIVSRYLQSQRAFEVLAARSGVEGVAKFYDRLGSVRLAPGTDAYHLERALQESVGWTTADWIRAWR